MTATGGEGSSGHEVIAWGGEQVQASVLQTVAILHHAADGSLAALLGAAQRLVLQRRDTSGLVAWAGVLTHRLTVREEILLEVIDHGYRLVEQPFRTAAVHQDGLGTEHLRHFGQHAGAALCHEPVAELTYERIGGDA